MNNGDDRPTPLARASGAARKAYPAREMGGAQGRALSDVSINDTRPCNDDHESQAWLRTVVSDFGFYLSVRCALWAFRLADGLHQVVVSTYFNSRSGVSKNITQAKRPCG